MAARDRFDIALKCPNCGNEGVARVSEDDYPFMRSPDFRIDSLPSGFIETKSAERRQDTEVMCFTCKTRFHL